MRRWLLLCAVVLGLLGCDDSQTVVVEPAEPQDPAPTIINIYEDETPDVIYVTEEDTTPDVVYIIQEDTTPDVVQEFYSDAADLPVLLWNVGGDVPMPKKLRQLNGGVAITAIQDDDAVGVDQASSGDSMFIDFANFPMPTNYIGGLITSPDAGDPDNDVNILPGSCRDVADAANLKLTAEITKQIDAAWVAGDDNGGMDTGAVAASTLYAVWLIKNPTTYAVDALFSLSFSAPTMPAGYTVKRLIGTVKTDGTPAIIYFLQSGDEFVYLGNAGTPPPEDISDATITNQVWETGALDSVPPLCMANVNVFLLNTTTTGTDASVWVRTTPPSSWAGFNPYWQRTLTASVYDAMAGMGRVMVDASQQIDYRANESDGAATLYVTVFGFTMLTRRDPQ